MQTITVLYGGGTISSIPTQEGYRAAHGGTDLLGMLMAHRPHSCECFRHLAISEPITVYRGLSENIDLMYQRLIAEQIKDIIAEQNPHGILLTFGTDSMLQMARFLHAELGALLTEKNIAFVLTGANKDTTLPDTDAWDNLQLALHSFGSLPSGVYIAFGGQVVAAEYAAMEPFDGSAMRFGDIRSEEYAAKVHQYDIRRQDQIDFFNFVGETGREKHALLYAVNRIDLLDFSTLYTAVEHAGVKAIIFILYHSGTANTVSATASVAALVEELRLMGVTCFGAAENGEPVTLNAYETSAALRRAGMVPLYDMDYQVAFAKARYMMQIGVHPADYIAAMYTPCCGEIDLQRINIEHKEELIQLYNPALEG